MARTEEIVRAITMLLTCGLFCSLLLLSPADASEPEHVSIQTLLSPQATSYHLRLVAVEGVTSDLQVLPPMVGRKCRLIYGRASFLLNDETSSLPVEFLCTCNPDAADALPKEGKRVRVTGIVDVLQSEAPRQVRVPARTIQVLESN